ncbi:MAG: methionine--tRNA ligase [SAR202 cluster bacterium]|jgi:methionyl-tRNA synthetase|nr:methionine--tRNA ligase [SAR202 cluster bacterium]MDP6713248.1 methionine--tRNA ligase [SAR202 cluster bacterium]
MSERILVAVAWPYANGSIHVGSATGAYLPADIFARYHRLKGNEVAMVSGSDAHGTPVTIAAEERGITPEDVYSEYQEEFLDDWKRLGISFDLFTTTHTDNHAEVSQDMFLKLMDNGYIYKDMMQQPFCETDDRFLPDRFVEGTCPHCGFDGARGDQCDVCGKILDPEDLINMVCKICGNAPIIRDTEHFFLKLSAFEQPLLDWIRKQDHFRPNVKNFTIGYLEGGLHDRAITRDLSWGVPVPIEGYEDKRIYVWFEAVIGYLSATKEWAKNNGDSERWKDFWQSDDCRAYYFMGKDNIPFHTIIWPAMLMGYGGLNLPYDLPANEYVNLEGQKVSTSRNWAVWLPDYLDRYEPDPLRYTLTANMPETSDSDFSWAEYLRRNNNELVATYGNLVHRVLSMVGRNFDGKIPQPRALDETARELLSEAQSRFDETEQNLRDCHFRAALQSAMFLAQAANRYLDAKAPWRAVKEDIDDAATTLWVGMTVINCLKTIFDPFLPFSSEKLHALLGLEGTVQDEGWGWSQDAMKPGAPLPKPRPLFTKLDDSIIEEETARLGK